jgi:hypothetical protein
MAGKLHDVCELFVEIICAGMKPDVVSHIVLLDNHLKEVLKKTWLEAPEEKIKYETKPKLRQLTLCMVDNDMILMLTITQTWWWACMMEFLDHAQQLFNEMLRKVLKLDVPERALTRDRLFCFIEASFRQRNILVVARKPVSSCPHFQIFTGLKIMQHDKTENCISTNITKTRDHPKQAVLVGTRRYNKNSKPLGS